MNPKAELEKEQRELQRLLGVQEATEVAIAKTKRRIAAWKELSDDTETGELVSEIDLDLGGLTDVCRTAMRASRKEWMTTAEIQQAIKELGFPLEKYKAPAASILTTVNRLAEGGEVVVDKRPQPGASEYKWVGSLSAARNRFEEATRALQGKTVPMSSLLPTKESEATRRPTVGQRVFRGMRKKD